LLPASGGFLFGLLFKPKDGGDMFLQNVGLSPDCTALQNKRSYSSPYKQIIVVFVVATAFFFFVIIITTVFVKVVTVIIISSTTINNYLYRPV
jgi:hypothetical protein